MSLDLQKLVWDDPEPRGQSKHVLVHLAWYVTKKEWDRGGPFRSWPSQNTVAEKCCIPRSSVQRALADLVQLGKIRDTGERRGRGAIVWEIYPSNAPEVKAGFEYADLTDSESGSGEVPDSRSGAIEALPDLTDSHPDLTDLHADLTDSEAGTRPTIGHERGNKGNQERELLERGARAEARDSGEGLSEELAEVERLLERRPGDKLLAGRRQELRDSLGAAA